MTGVSHERKLRLSALSLPLPVDDNPWFWNPMDASGHRPLLLSRYESRRPASSICLLSR